jgi:hypothetical protein
MTSRQVARERNFASRSSAKSRKVQSAPWKKGLRNGAARAREVSVGHHSQVLGGLKAHDGTLEEAAEKHSETAY